ncbi:hypothetical protein ES288_D13G159600v1 [Gossypium darwinii]|uniref:Uncharacterized protein n=1 Tax=Gossypium darwinii TaxID=34276 RepID=A0A5D2A299_GOSDA|nr:hypothetical protein ES288_D13G159600v1 [Gossypium darwinii]
MHLLLSRQSIAPYLDPTASLVRMPALQLQIEKALRSEKTPVGSPRQIKKSVYGVFARGMAMILLASTSSNAFSIMSLSTALNLHRSDLPPSNCHFLQL